MGGGVKGYTSGREEQVQQGGAGKQASHAPLEKITGCIHTLPDVTTGGLKPDGVNSLILFYVLNLHSKHPTPATRKFPQGVPQAFEIRFQRKHTHKGLCARPILGEPKAILDFSVFCATN